MWSKSGGSGTSEKFDTFADKFSFTEGYQVLCEIGDNASVAENAGGVPKYGDQHESGREAYVTSKTTMILGPIFWTVVVGYDGESYNNNTADIEWSDTSSSEAIDRDYNGRAIVTVNNEQIEGLSMELSDPLVVIRRRFSTVNTFAFGQYRFSTNSDTYLGWPPGTARLVGYSAKNQFKYGYQLEQWDVTIRIQFRYPLMGATAEQAWYKRWRHEGIYVNTDGIIHRALDNLGQEVTKPVLLRANGTRELNPNNALFVYTKVYGSLPYAALGFI